MPTAQTGSLGLQEDGGSGKQVGFRGEILAGNGIISYLSASLITITGAQATTRLYTAATSGLFAIAYTLDIISQSVAGTTIIPRVQFFSPLQGAGTQILAAGAAIGANVANVSSSGILWIQAAASDIFISTLVNGTVGVPPTYNLGFHLFRAS